MRRNVTTYCFPPQTIAAAAPSGKAKVLAVLRDVTSEVVAVRSERARSVELLPDMIYKMVVDEATGQRPVTPAMAVKFAEQNLQNSRDRQIQAQQQVVGLVQQPPQLPEVAQAWR